VPASIFGERFTQYVLEQLDRGSQHQSLRAEVRPTLERLVQRVEPSDERAGEVRKGDPVVGQLDGLPVYAHEFHAELYFEPSDLLPDRRGGQSQCISGTGEAILAGHLDQRSQLLEPQLLEKLPG